MWPWHITPPITFYLGFWRSIFSCVEAALRTLLSVRPSVTPFWQCSCHRIILQFSGVITIDRHDVHAKGKGHRSWPHLAVWIHIWQWNDAQSLMLLRRGALLFFKVIRQISMSRETKKSPILTQIGCFRTLTRVWIHRWLWNDAQSLK